MTMKKEIKTKNPSYWSTTILPALVSGLVAVILTFFLTIKYEENRAIKEYNLSILKDIVAYKHILGHPEVSGSEQFISSFNQIPLAFTNSPKVLTSLGNFIIVRKNEKLSDEANNEAFVDLVNSMYDDIGLGKNRLTEKQIMTVSYVPKK